MKIKSLSNNAQGKPAGKPPRSSKMEAVSYKVTCGKKDTPEYKESIITVEEPKDFDEMLDVWKPETIYSLAITQNATNQKNTERQKLAGKANSVIGIVRAMIANPASLTPEQHAALVALGLIQG